MEARLLSEMEELVSGPINDKTVQLFNYLQKSDSLPYQLLWQCLLSVREFRIILLEQKNTDHFARQILGSLHLSTTAVLPFKLLCIFAQCIINPNLKLESGYRIYKNQLEYNRLPLQDCVDKVSIVVNNTDSYDLASELINSESVNKEKIIKQILNIDLTNSLWLKLFRFQHSDENQVLLCNNMNTSNIIDDDPDVGLNQILNKLFTQTTNTPNAFINLLLFVFNVAGPRLLNSNDDWYKNPPKLVSNHPHYQTIKAIYKFLNNLNRFKECLGVLSKYPLLLQFSAANSLMKQESYCHWCGIKPELQGSYKIWKILSRLISSLTGDYDNFANNSLLNDFPLQFKNVITIFSSIGEEFKNDIDTNIDRIDDIKQALDGIGEYEEKSNNNQIYRVYHLLDIIHNLGDMFINSSVIRMGNDLCRKLGMCGWREVSSRFIFPNLPTPPEQFAQDVTTSSGTLTSVLKAIVGCSHLIRIPNDGIDPKSNVFINCKPFTEENLVQGVDKVVKKIKHHHILLKNLWMLDVNPITFAPINPNIPPNVDSEFKLDSLECVTDLLKIIVRSIDTNFAVMLVVDVNTTQVTKVYPLPIWLQQISNEVLNDTLIKCGYFYSNLNDLLLNLNINNQMCFFRNVRHNMSAQMNESNANDLQKRLSPELSEDSTTVCFLWY